MKNNTTHGGRRPNQTGRPKSPDPVRSISVSLRTSEIAYLDAATGRGRNGAIKAALRNAGLLPSMPPNDAPRLTSKRGRA